eukprot:843799-Amphidinium_carterae.2
MSSNKPLYCNVRALEEKGSYWCGQPLLDVSSKTVLQQTFGEVELGCKGGELRHWSMSFYNVYSLLSMSRGETNKYEEPST